MRNKYFTLIIVIGLLAIVIGALVLYRCWSTDMCFPPETIMERPEPENISPIDRTSKIFNSKEECENVTKNNCDFQMCDFIPAGESPDVCAGQTGWSPSPNQ